MKPSHLYSFTKNALFSTATCIEVPTKAWPSHLYLYLFVLGNMLESTIIIDGRDHLLGRLASIVAKELLAGQKVVIVRCEDMVVSGSSELSKNEVGCKCKQWPLEWDEIRWKNVNKKIISMVGQHICVLLRKKKHKSGNENERKENRERLSWQKDGNIPRLLHRSRELLVTKIQQRYWQKEWSQIYTSEISSHELLVVLAKFMSWSII